MTNLEYRIANRADRLLSKNQESIKRFEVALDNLVSDKQKQAIRSMVVRRRRNVKRLENEIFKLNAEPIGGTSLAAELHAFWINVKGTLTGQNHTTILTECLQAEKSLLDDYSLILMDSGLNKDLKDTIEHQLENVKEDINELTAMIRQE